MARVTGSSCAPVAGSISKPVIGWTSYPVPGSNDAAVDEVEQVPGGRVDQQPGGGIDLQSGGRIVLRRRLGCGGRFGGRQSPSWRRSVSSVVCGSSADCARSTGASDQPMASSLYADCWFSCELPSFDDRSRFSLDLDLVRLDDGHVRDSGVGHLWRFRSEGSHTGVIGPVFGELRRIRLRFGLGSRRAVADRRGRYRQERLRWRHRQRRAPAADRHRSLRRALERRDRLVGDRFRGDRLRDRLFERFRCAPSWLAPPSSIAGAASASLTPSPLGSGSAAWASSAERRCRPVLPPSPASGLPRLAR